MVHAKWHMDLERDDQDLKSGVKVTNIDCPCVTVVLVSSKTSFTNMKVSSCNNDDTCVVLNLLP
jgi:hypothetical protein